MAAVTPFALAAVVLAVALAGCLGAALRGDTEGRVVALQLAGVVTALLLLVLSRARSETSFVHVALVVVAVSVVSSFLYARFLEHWL